MPLPIITNTIRVAVSGTAANSHRWANILHFRYSGVLTALGAITILDPKLVAHYTTDSGAGSAWKSQSPTSASVTEVRYTPLDGISASTVNSHSIVGIVGGDALPASMALVVTLRTAKRGRSYRGRVYTGPYGEVSNTAVGAPNAGLPAAIAAQWNALIASLAATGVSLVVASYVHSTAEDVTTCTADTRWDTQRRRLNA